MMDFNEALDALKAGKKVRAINWAPSDFVVLVNNSVRSQDNSEFFIYYSDTQSEWELYENSEQLDKWIKFSEQKPQFLPFWMFSDGNVSIKICHDDDFLTYVDDKESAAWMMINYPLPPRDEEQYTKWNNK
jgi:hypothetical protein